MRTVATRTLASVLAALLAASCGTVSESVQPDLEERVFLPRAPRVVASPVVDELELRRAIEELLPYMDVEATQAELRRMVADPRFHGRGPEELRVVLAGWGSGPAALEEIARGYRAFCAATQRTNCLEGPLTDSSVYQIAFDFALGSQWDGFVGEVKSTIDPSTIRLVLLTGMVIFMATIAIPELLSKIPAAAATVVLTAYLGAQTVCDLIFGWIQMVRELDAATTFNQVRAAGEHYGRLVGAQTARVLILLATAAIAQGGLIARLMKLPRATQASAALAAETGGVGLEAVGAVRGAQVLQGGVAITLQATAKGAVSVAMAAHGPVPGAGGGGASKPAVEARAPQPVPEAAASKPAPRAPRAQKSLPEDVVAQGEPTLTARFRRLRGKAREAEWVSPKQGEHGPGLRDHAGKHGEQVGAKSVREYDLSARETIQNGSRFRYRDPSTNEPRIGYWDQNTGLFTATSETRRLPIILTHFPETWAKLRRLPGFTVD